MALADWFRYVALEPDLLALTCGAEMVTVAL
jgi:hypothetical protein